MEKRGRRTLRLLLVGLVFLLLALAAGEIWVRRSGLVDNYYRPRRSDKALPWLDLLHVESPVPGLAYELAPNWKKRVHRVEIETNSYGMRDTEPLPEDTPGLVRIAVLGDSETFAATVPGDLTYPNVLERLLNQRFAEKGLVFDVLNFGVGGYGTRDEALVFAHKVLRWKPALVVVHYVLNDPELDPFQPLIAHYHEAEWWQYSFESIHENASSHGIDSLLFIQPAIPEQTWQDYRYRDLHRKVADAARTSGFDVLDLYDTYAQHPPASLRVSSTDNHSNTAAHRLIAETLLPSIIQHLDVLTQDAR